MSKAKENTSDYVPLAQAVEREVVSVPECDLNTSPTAAQPIVTTGTNQPELKHVVPDEITQHAAEQLRTKVPPPESDSQLSAKQKYLALWQRYSQGLTGNDPINLDIQVAQRALKDSKAQKDIALMLSAGSPMVQKIIRNQGKKQAMIYVNQTTRKICTFQQVGRSDRIRTLKASQQIEVELS